jgi:hypothetical protein
MEKKYTTPSEQFLIQIGNIVEAEAISIPLRDKYMSFQSVHSGGITYLLCPLPTVLCTIVVNDILYI